MRTSILCLIVASVLIAVSAEETSSLQYSNPNIPSQFVCSSCTYTFVTPKKQYTSNGTWWFDADANMSRKDYLDGNGNPFEFLEAIGLSGTGYECAISPPASCSVKRSGNYSVDRVFHQFAIGAWNLGPELVNGIDCVKWGIVLSDEKTEYILYVQSGNNKNPIRYRVSVWPHNGEYYAIDFYDFVPGKPPAGTFNIPSYCKTR